MLLLGGKGFAVLSSNSVSLLASLVDSALDLLSTLIIFGTSVAISHVTWRTWYAYPTGRKRLEVSVRSLPAVEHSLTLGTAARVSTR